MRSAHEHRLTALAFQSVLCLSVYVRLFPLTNGTHSQMHTDMPCNGVLVPAGTGRNDYISGYRRGLCLPPSFSCSWVSYDDTTTELVCSLPDKSTQNVAQPDEAVSRSQTFFVRSCVASLSWVLARFLVLVKLMSMYVHYISGLNSVASTANCDVHPSIFSV